MYIIVCEFCERLAYYGLAGSLVLLLQDELSYTNADADNQVSKALVHPRRETDYVSLRHGQLWQYSLWSGFCYVTPLLGGWIADSYLGRYKYVKWMASPRGGIEEGFTWSLIMRDRAIMIFSSIYVVGLVLLVIGVLPVSPAPHNHFPHTWAIFSTTQTQRQGKGEGFDLEPQSV
jgi:hypothetical protein